MTTQVTVVTDHGEQEFRSWAEALASRASAHPQLVTQQDGPRVLCCVDSLAASEIGDGPFAEIYPATW